jgi:predicted  nucleic acid-binding Zn-ribbon protein
MDLSIENKLKALWSLQEIDSKLDQLNALKGELPIEVSDLEDAIAGLETRKQNIENEIQAYQDQISGYRNKIKQSEQFILKFKQQLNEVKNNREFEALTKEIEIMELEIVAAQKRINEAEAQIEFKNQAITETEKQIEASNQELELKKAELVTIIQETEKEEQVLADEKSSAAKHVEERLIKAYNRIRKNAKNGVAIAPIMRSSCGGCFGKIPPQMQADIRQHLKITACEYCGRILVDASITGIQAQVEDTDDKPRRRLKKRLGAAN